MGNEGYIRATAGRMARAVRNIAIGTVLIAAATVLHCWNEWRAAQSAAGLTSSAAGVRTVDPTQIDRANDGRLVHFTANVAARGQLTDPLFGISARVLRLRRTVEMYQWDEAADTSERRGPGVRIHRMAVWDRKYIDARGFRRGEGRLNPPMPLPELVLTAGQIMAGAYEVPPELLDRIGAFEKLPLTDAATRPATGPAATQPVAVAPAAASTGPAATRPAMSGASGAATRPAIDPGEFRVVDGVYLYRGADPQKPRIGDVRVSFDVVKPGIYTILAKQLPGTGRLAPGFSKVNNQQVFGILPGAHPPEAIHREPGSPNTPLYWVLRGAGVLAMWVGLALVLRPLAFIAGFVPFVRSVVAIGVIVSSLLLGLALSAVAAGLVWLPYEPLIGGGLIAGAVFVVFAARAAGALLTRSRQTGEGAGQ